MTIFRGLTLVYTNGNPISSLSEDDRFLEFGQGYVAGLPVPAIMMLIMFFILSVHPAQNSAGTQNLCCRR